MYMFTKIFSKKFLIIILLFSLSLFFTTNAFAVTTIGLNIDTGGTLTVTGNASLGTVNGNTITTGTGILTLGASKTLTISNTLTLAGTDSSTLNIGTGGTLGTAAYTASTAYASALGADDNYVTDAEKVVIGNTSGTNTGNNAVNTLYSGLAASKADVGQTFYIGTTQVAINRASAALTLAGLTLTTPDLGTPSAVILTNASGTATNLNIGGNAATVTNGVYTTGAGTVFLAPNGSAASLTSFPTLNQNTTGNALTATTATHLAGGLGGQIPYQSAAGTTALLANGAAGQVLQSNGTTLAPSWVAAATGTVTSASVVSANGFAGTIATATTTPAITLTTSITGLLKGNGTAISAATAGTDYSAGTSALATGILKSTTTTGALTIAVAGDFPTLNQNTTGSAATLTTARAIYGNDFNGSVALTGIIASTYGGTGNGFTKFSGPTTAEKTFTLPDASATILTTNAAVTVAQGGTGASTLTGILIGNGTSAVTGTALTAGQSIRRNAGDTAYEGFTASSGTVTSASVVSANGFAGSVATATTTPAITLTTSVTGLLKGNGTAISAATAGTDYSAGTNALATGILKSTTTTGALTIAVAGDFPTLNQNTTGSAATLTTARAIYGNNFDGSAALTGIIASTYGGTGNGFTKFSGPTTSEKTFTLPDASATIATIDATQTLTNKRTNPRIVSTTSYTTDTGTSLDVSTADQFVITAQAGALLFNAPGGTPVEGQKLIIRIKDNGTARALTYNAVFRAMGVALPTTTVISKTLYMGFIYNSTDTKWDLVATAQEA